MIVYEEMEFGMEQKSGWSIRINRMIKECESG